MKTAYFTRIVVALVALFVSTAAFAASDYLLELEGIKGECVGKHIKLIEQPDGSFTAENILSGTYKLVAKPNNTSGAGTGKVSISSFNFMCIVSPRDVASGQASGKRDHASGQSSGKRDHASGQATGKRQHKPYNIVKTNLSIPSSGLTISEIVVTKSQDDGAEGTSITGDGPKATYDLKLAKKV